MRMYLRLSLLAAVACLGCGSTPGHLASDSPISTQSRQDPARGAGLHVAFDDISAPRKVAVPIRLTASDGSGLALVSLKARAVVDDPLAFTELHLVFENPENRVREGTFTIVLPQGASISRFAMKNDNGMLEGEVVERKAAREAYEDFLHRKQDPALLEQNAGNELSARVFPIPARGRKELVVAYSQELTSASPYVLPLRGLPEIEALDVEAYLAGRAAPVQKLAAQKTAPAADFRLDTKVLVPRSGLRNGNLVVTRVRPVAAARPEPLGSTLILVDTSASRALGMADEARVVKRICAAIAAAAGDAGQVTVAAFDQEIAPIYEGPAGGFGDEAIGKMRQRLALGASNLEAALAWAGDRARSKGEKRVVLVGDGIPTAGATAGDALRARVAAWREAGVERLDAIGVGGIRDDGLLRSLANAGLAKGGAVIDGSVEEAELVRRLSEATVSGIEVKVEGARFVFPKTLDGVQAGDEALVYANLPEADPARISVGGQPLQTLDLARVERPLLERAWVGAKIQSLLETERKDGASEALSKEIVGLSTRFRVLSPKSALLVLETEADYKRFGIDRRALADILTADAGRVSLVHRALPAPVKVPPPAPVVQAPKKKPSGAPQVRMGAVSTAGGAGATDGMVGALRSPSASPPPAWGGSALGNDPLSARGNMWGEGAPGAGSGGLGLSGIGEGGSGRGEGIGLGSIGTIGHGAGTGSGAGFGASATVGASQGVAPPPPAPPPPPAAERGRPGEGEGGGVALPPPARGAVAGGSEADDAPMAKTDPYTGPFKEVMSLIDKGRLDEAVSAAFAWRKRDPGDVLALVALGEGFEAAGDLAQAARCYGSIIDLFPSRADMRRFAGERLERLTLGAALDLAADTYAKAEEQRPDHPASHRLLGYALLRQGHPEKAFDAIARGLARPYPAGRFAGATRILAEDLGLVGAAWAKAEPARAEEILKRVRAEGGLIEDQPSIRFVLGWETDANDVDFHIRDGLGHHAYYSRPELASGGRLYADVTTGYGPECFTIRGAPKERSGPYTLQANYYSRGPMGYGMGKLEIIEHDGHGGLTFRERPFIVMQDHAFVDLGSVLR